MNKTYRISIYIFISVIIISQNAGCSRDVAMKGSEFGARFRPVPRTAILEGDDNYRVWGGSMTRADDGTCYLFYSRIGEGSWLHASEIACATADHPLGPYHFQKVVLPGSGGNNWDAQMTHNPTVKKFGDKFYRYYIGTKIGETYEDYGDNSRTPEVVNLRVHQRIGVAVADHPCGPWKRYDTPLIDVEPGTIRHYFVTNPSVTQCPDGSYLMVYKSMRYDGRTVHGTATATEPAGPFKPNPQAIFTYKKDGFPAEDPHLWYENGRYYVILKDFKAYFTGVKFGLALFESRDGLNWNLCEEPLVNDRTLYWADGKKQHFEHLERPQLWFENGKPAVLFCAAIIKENGRERRFNIHIPLKDF